MQALRFIIADDHPLFRRALYEAVAVTFPEAVIEEAGDLDAVQNILVQDNGVDLILLDLKMPGAHGFSGLLFLRGQFPEIPIVIVSGVDDETIMCQAVTYGAFGFIPKSTTPTKITDAIQCVLKGETWLPPGASQALAHQSGLDEFSARMTTLTPQQFKALSLMVEGKLNKQISHDMGISLSTVKAHVTEILKKLGYQRRTQVIAAMQRLALNDQSDTSN